VVDLVAALHLAVLLGTARADVAVPDAAPLDGEDKGECELGTVVGLDLSNRRCVPELRFRGCHGMGSTTIVDSGANTGLDFLLRSPQLAVPPVGTRSEARVPPQGRASEAPKRHLRGGACSLMPHASVGVTRARSEPTPSREKKPVDTFIPRPSCLPMRLG